MNRPRSNQEPKVSIIVPCYNCRKYLTQAIESCHSQTYRNIEIILVDDGSTDGSCDAFESQSDVHLIRQKNLGAGAARNNGLAHAKGQYIKFLDADDMLVPTCIAEQIQESHALETQEIVYGDFQTLWNDDPRPFGNYQVVPGRLSCLILYNIMTSTPLHKKELLDRVCGFDERLPNGQEWNLHVRLGASGVRFLYRPTKTYVYRFHWDESRLTLQAHNRPETRTKNYLKYQLTLDAIANVADEDALSAMSELLWGVGRTELQRHDKDVARMCFRSARRAAPSSYKQSWSKVYRMVHSLFGDYHSEAVMAFLHKLKT